MKHSSKIKLTTSAIFGIFLFMLSLLPQYSLANSSEALLSVKVVLSNNMVRQLIDDTFVVMQEHYIEQEVVASTKQFVVSKFEQGQYDSISSLDSFAKVIGRDIRNITGDEHLSLFTIKPTEEVTHILKHKLGKLSYNYAFEELRYLDGNIGYLKFNKFYSDRSARDIADAAFIFLKQSDGMIIDLRDTIGGSPDLVSYLLSYFLPNKTPLWEMIGQNNQKFDAVLVNEQPKHQRFHHNYPVWILTSSNSASATELFAGTMQANNKATIIGDTTAGAGFYVGVEPITPELIFRISLSKPVISANQQNWEKIGIKPDLNVPALDALNHAQRMAFESLVRKN
jgi:C-terminal processing protease CtpA/Prc